MRCKAQNLPEFTGSNRFHSISEPRNDARNLLLNLIPSRITTNSGRTKKSRLTVELAVDGGARVAPVAVDLTSSTSGSALSLGALKYETYNKKSNLVFAIL